MLHLVVQHKALIGILCPEFIGQAVQMMVQVHVVSKEAQMTMLSATDTFLKRI